MMSKIVTFDDLIKAHGPLDAMRILEGMEAMMWTKIQIERLDLSPEERFMDVMDQVIEGDFAAA
jgi:hypothetical protein